MAGIDQEEPMNIELPSTLAAGPLRATAALEPMSLQALLDRILADTSLPPTRRRDMASSIRAAGRLAGRPLAEIAADCEILNATVFPDVPQLAGLQPERFRNVVSGLRAALRHVGRHAEDERTLPPEGSPWCGLLDCLGEHERLPLIAFARWAGQHSIEPHAVRRETFDLFGTWVRVNHLRRRIDGLVRNAMRAWDRLAARTPGLVAVGGPEARRGYTLPLDAHPETFRGDVRAFADRIGGQDLAAIFPVDANPFAAAGRTRPRKPVRPATLQARLFQIRQAAAALVLNGMRPEQIVSLRTLVDPIENARAIIQHYWERGGRTAGSQVGGVAEVLRQIAKFHIGLPEDQVERLAEWRHTTSNRRSTGMTPKNRERLRAMVTPAARFRLLHLPATLMAEAARTPKPFDAARRALIAAEIEILLICPLRLKNLRLLELDRHLRRQGPCGRRISHIVIQPAETKNSNPVEWPVPPETARVLETYLRRYRPTLAAPSNAYLFPGRGTAPRSDAGIAKGIINTVARQVGVRVNVHLFRHFAAWLYLKNHPGEYEIVRRALGHRSIATTVAFYCGLEAEAAARRFDDVVLAERARTRALLGRGKKKERRS
jgi:integrase